MTETAHLALSPLEHISECVSQQNRYLTAKYSEVISSLSIDRHRHGSIGMLC